MKGYKFTRVTAAAALLLSGIVAAGSNAAAEPPPGEGITIATSITTPRDNQAVSLVVNTSDILAPTGAHWTFGDGAEADGLTVTHQWATARSAPYPVTVTATMPGGEELTKSIDITVHAGLDVSVEGGDETISVQNGGTIQCSTVCSGAYQVGTQTTLTAQTTVGRMLGRWGGACASAGTANTCVVTLDTSKTVTYTVEEHLVSLSLWRNSPAALGTFSAGLPGAEDRLCASFCTYEFPYDSDVFVEARGIPGDTEWQSWSDDCRGVDISFCVVKMNGNKNATASFSNLEPFVAVVCDFLSSDGKSQRCRAFTSQVNVDWKINGQDVPEYKGSKQQFVPCPPFTLSLALEVKVTNSFGSDVDSYPALTC